MSSSQPPRPPASGSTRQLLDDLDALMQRMLALPVEQDEDEDEPPEGRAADRPAAAAPPAFPGYAEPEPPPEPPAAPVVLTLTAVPPPGPPAASEPAPPAVRQDGPEPPAGPHAPSAGYPVLAPIGPEVFSGLTAPGPYRPRVTVPRPAPVRARPADRLRPARGLLLRPLYWTNRAFDRGTEWLGPPGRWLRGRRGRAALGWAGLGLLGAAAGWQVLVWLGW